MAKPTFTTLDDPYGTGGSGVIAEELQAVGLVCGEQPLQEQPSEQAREHAHRQEEAGLARHPAARWAMKHGKSVKFTDY